MSRYRNACFTAWSPLGLEVTSKVPGELCKYLVVGKEVCPETKKVHYQGYLELSTQVSMKTLKTWLCQETVHIEHRKGTAAQAADYCKKDGEYEEFGTISKPGKRNDLAVMREMVKDGAEDHEIVDVITSFQALNSIDKLRTKMIVPHKSSECVEYIYKKIRAKELQAHIEPIGDYDDMSYAGIYWIGYTGKKTVAIIEKETEECPQRMEKLLRPGRKVINIKQGCSLFAPEKLYHFVLF